MLMDICKAEAKIRLMRQLKLIPKRKEVKGDQSNVTGEDAS